LKNEPRSSKDSDGWIIGRCAEARTVASEQNVAHPVQQLASPTAAYFIRANHISNHIIRDLILLQAAGGTIVGLCTSAIVALQPRRQLLRGRP